MTKFKTLREEFESETGAHAFADQQYIKWLEKVVEKERAVKNSFIPVDVGRSEQLPILDRCGCEEPNEEPIKVCMNCNGYVE